MHLFQIYSSVLCDMLCFSRNKVIHDGSIPNILKLASSIKKSALAHAAAWLSVSALEVPSMDSSSGGQFQDQFRYSYQRSFLSLSCCLQRPQRLHHQSCFSDFSSLLSELWWSLRSFSCCLLILFFVAWTFCLERGLPYYYFGFTIPCLHPGLAYWKDYWWHLSSSSSLFDVGNKED